MSATALAVYSAILLQLASCSGPQRDGVQDEDKVSPFGMEIGEVWAGNYTCGVPAWMLLHVTGTFPLEAVFHFAYPNSGTHGAFSVKQTGDVDGGVVTLDAYEWMYRPQNTEMVGLQGALRDDGKRFKGIILHENCGDFSLVRTTVDEPLVQDALALEEGTTTDAAIRALNVMKVSFLKLEVALTKR